MSKLEVKIVQDKTWDVIKSATNKLVDFTRPTFGPASNKVIIDKMSYRMVVDDGVQIARDFDITDNPEENAVLKVIKEVAIKQNDRMGDGTTGALIMFQAMINEIGRKGKRNGHKIEKELKEGLAQVKQALTDSAKKIETKEDLKKVALVAFDDEVIAEMIADAYFKMGKDAIITIDKSNTLETTCEMADGISISRGYISPYMVNNPERMETVIEKPYILITDYRITEVNDILPLMEKMAKEKKGGLVIVADNVEQNALSTLVINLPHVMNPQTRQLGTFSSVAIVAPNDTDRKVFLEDLALLTGATMFSDSKGNKLEKAEISDLGRADKIIVKREESVIVKPRGNEADIAVAITSLRSAVESETDERRKKDAQRRLGMFTNSIATIKVGALTEQEQKALKYKVEDAVNAVKEAFKHGVVCGAGRALAQITTSSPILNAALKQPARQLLENMGIDEEDMDEFGVNEVLNVVTGEIGNFMDVGVMDPAGSLIAGVESAVSITNLLVTGSGILVQYEKEEKR